MSPEDAHEILSANTPIDKGHFYGNKQKVAIGAGVIYSGILTPFYSLEDKLFLTVRQPIYILTHECDIDQANERPFNDSVCFCPIIPIPAFIRRFSQKWPDDSSAKSFLAQVAQRKIGRVVYLPPVNQNPLEYGGLIYINNISSTHISVFDGQEPIAALTQYSLLNIDSAIHQALLRPKSDLLSR